MARKIACFLIVCALLCGGCLGFQSVISACDNGGPCPTCKKDSDCIIVSNPCHSTATCAHKDAGMVTNSIGCQFEHKVPSDEVCKCVRRQCRKEG